MFQINSWLIYTLLALFLYGLWGFFSKLATNYIDPKSALLNEVLGALMVSLVLFSNNGFRVRVDRLGIFYAVLVGVSGTLATFLFFIAITKGASSIILPLTSLYPLVTILLSVFILKESLSLKQSLGILLALVAIVLCSMTD
ncbi:MULTISPECIES: EamA family transporter [Nostocales]|uniref:EamA family transporter n=3 Tax=Nostocales TaxID=1161 RepID=A0A0C1R7N5_9CYAN|nr:EamA family transporter [Tolypothrix bouteillei]KAF3885713.1 EamA family transporter [Tolypothrix bouteillei VB521301]